MANTLFQRFEYGFNPSNTNVIIEFSADTVATINSVQSIVPEWAYQDLKDQNAHSYIVNPVGNVSNQLISIVGTLKSTTGNVPGLSSMYSVANTCANAVTNFYDHTQRLSGLVEVDANNETSPYYDTAIGIGKTLAFMTYQADGYANTSSILGSFTSILVEDDLNNLVITLNGYNETLNNSLTYNVITFQMQSNLSAGIQTTMKDSMNAITTFVDTRRTHDENFYTNCLIILDEYNDIKRYTRMGETEEYLIRNFLGTEKLISRLDG